MLTRRAGPWNVPLIWPFRNPSMRPYTTLPREQKRNAVMANRPEQQNPPQTAEYLALALAASGAGDYVWDLATDAVHLSPRAAALFGLSPAEPATRQQMLAMIDPEDA